MQPVEKWRYRCPRDHTGWEFTGRQFWCAQCHVGSEESATFERLHDRKTDDLVGPGEWRQRR